ncbi:MAG: SLBB domain-containing protein [Candidatus Omnitrophica bacterium]|nr:SLBB domain-containing protein [Candidatus Omnitrophota bacterium]
MRKILIFSFFIFVIFGVSIAQNENGAVKDIKSKVDSDYQIGISDLLEIKVYEEPDLSREVRVGPDGNISYPLIGNIKAEGLTARELEKKLTDLLSGGFMVSPQVSVFIKQYAEISILGEVKTPGSYEMKAVFSLTQAIATAGGFTDKADTSKVKIIRNVGNKKMTMEVDAQQILDREVPDIDLKGNDTIVVDKLGTISVLGKVEKPGVFDLKKGMTVLDAIALAGGLSETAMANGTKVIRTYEGKKQIYVVPVGSILKTGDETKDIELEPDDTISVPESFF